MGVNYNDTCKIVIQWIGNKNVRRLHDLILISLNKEIQKRVRSIGKKLSI